MWVDPSNLCLKSLIYGAADSGSLNRRDAKKVPFAILLLTDDALISWSAKEKKLSAFVLLSRSESAAPPKKHKTLYFDIEKNQKSGRKYRTHPWWTIYLITLLILYILVPWIHLWSTHFSSCTQNGRGNLVTLFMTSWMHFFYEPFPMVSIVQVRKSFTL